MPSSDRTLNRLSLGFRTLQHSETKYRDIRLSCFSTDIWTDFRQNRDAALDDRTGIARLPQFGMGFP